MQNQQVQPDSFTSLLMNFQNKPVNKMQEFFKGKLEQKQTNGSSSNNILKQNKPPELPPRDDFDDEDKGDESSDFDREEVRDKVHT